MTRSILRFGFLTAASFAVNLGLTVLFHEGLMLPEELAFGLALIIVFMLNFIGCRHFVFENTNDTIGRQFVLFLGTSIGFRGAEFMAFLILHTAMRVQYVTAIISIKCLATAAKFIWCRNVVFASRHREKEDA